VDRETFDLTAKPDRQKVFFCELEEETESKREREREREREKIGGRERKRGGSLKPASKT